MKNKILQEIQYWKDKIKMGHSTTEKNRNRQKVKDLYKKLDKCG